RNLQAALSPPFPERGETSSALPCFLKLPVLLAEGRMTNFGYFLAFSTARRLTVSEAEPALSSCTAQRGGRDLASCRQDRRDNSRHSRLGASLCRKSVPNKTRSTRAV